MVMEQVMSDQSHLRLVQPEQSYKYLQKPFDEVQKVTEDLLDGDIS